MNARNSLFKGSLSKVVMVMLVPLLLVACSSNKKDLGDSDGVIISQTDGLNTDTTTITDGTPIYDGNTLGSVDSSAVPGSQQDLVNNAGDLVFFGYDSSELDSQSRSVLEAQARWLQNYPNLYITIEGHADERGTREYNLALADRRANSTKNFLVAMGVSSSRINTISYGKEKPLMVGADTTSWAQNRRAQTRVQ